MWIIWLFVFNATIVEKIKRESSPIDFRCDAMKVQKNPHIIECVGHVIAVREGMMLCCNKFTIYTDRQWKWEKATCEGDVRSRKADRLIWSEWAQYQPSDGVLVLEKDPLLQRGQSLIRGNRVYFYMKTDETNVEQPSGNVATVSAENMTWSPPAKLGSQCPLSRRPK